jgi:hypothetical protein
MCTSLPSSSTP